MNNLMKPTTYSARPSRRVTPVGSGNITARPKNVTKARNRAERRARKYKGVGQKVEPWNK